MAVCSYCRSTVMRDGASMEHLGKLSDILDDYSPVQIGTTGNWKGRPFNVIGRLRLQYEDGSWNEWCVEFGDGTLGWLSDASGQFAITQKRNTAPPPAFDACPVGRNGNFGGTKFSVTDSRICKCVGGEGELPGIASDGLEFKSVDLRSVGGNQFITFDYSDNPPSVYVGDACSLDELALKNLRSEESIRESSGTLKGRVAAFDCPSCGGSLEYHIGFGETIACKYCKSVVKLEGSRQTFIAKQKEINLCEPTIPLGSKGMLRGVEREIVGFILREDASGDDWEEYLLFSTDPAFRFIWLIHSKNKWYFSEVLNVLPEEKEGQVFSGGKVYHYNCDYLAKTIFVLGEFNWRVKVGSAARVSEWTLGETQLSRETYQEEVTWSVSSRIPAPTIAKIFGIPEIAVESPPKEPSETDPAIPWSWVFIACGSAFLIDIVAHISGRGSFTALAVAALALWAPKLVFKGEQQ